MGYQHEVIVGDEDPSLSFASSPSWTHTFEDISTKDDILAISLYDSLGGIASIENDDDNDSCNNPEDAIDGTSDCSNEIKDSNQLRLHDVTETKRKRPFKEIQNEAELEDYDYARLLAGCKIIKKECSGYLDGISIATEDDLTESSQSDDEQHSTDEGELTHNVKCEPRITMRHDSGGSAANSDEEIEPKVAHNQKVGITLQPKVLVTTSRDISPNSRN